MKKLLVPLTAVVAVAILSSCTPSNYKIEKDSVSRHLGYGNIECELLDQSTAKLPDGKPMRYKSKCWPKANPSKAVVALSSYTPVASQRGKLAANVFVSAPASGGNRGYWCRWTNSNSTGNWRLSQCTVESFSTDWSYRSFMKSPA